MSHGFCDVAILQSRLPLPHIAFWSTLSLFSNKPLLTSEKSKRSAIKHLFREFVYVSGLFSCINIMLNVTFFTKNEEKNFLSMFDWALFPKAESYLQSELDKVLSRHNSAATLVNEVQQKTSTRIFDWVDHLVVPLDEVDADDLFKLGFHESKTIEDSNSPSS